MPFDNERTEFERRKAQALSMGSPKRLAERQAQGILNARERVDRLLDAGSFHEAGLFATSIRPEMRDKTPGDGVVCGFGTMGGRLVGVNAADFTVLGSSSAEVHGKKQGHVRALATRNGFPIVNLMECAGGRIPDIMGAGGIGMSGERAVYRNPRQVPWISAVMGLTYGGGAFTCINSDIVVMRKGAVLAVSSQMVTSVAIGEEEDPQSLGGWRHHSEMTGLIDVLAESDEEAIATVKRALSYLPDHAGALPPRLPPPKDDPARDEAVLTLVPESRAKVYDVRMVIKAVVDADSFFPLKERFAKVAVTALARLGGQVVGIVASNPMFKGGALDPDACDKIASFIVLCDSYNIPLIFLADTPGFLVGAESEKKRLPAKIMTFMSALEQATVPKIALVLRKSYGQAYLNMGGGKADITASWFTGDISFMDPAVAVNVVFAVKREDDPARHAALVAEVAAGTTPYELAAPFLAHSVIDPRDTRRTLISMLQILCRRTTGGLGEHRLANWPHGF
ncbi:MAG TPA: methylmalonyl-CoA carboxyltransferase [Alphaproteobacteria bacterium]|nr:methylmalonyl-CoA carboxyltransferase [Alphaproteobacteria bacterium]HAJ46974.1 methylmalonyl-CoA carboxyltransferase [Alphaproteobacteria bacterium]